jgi:hypothetical protein
MHGENVEEPSWAWQRTQNVPLVIPGGSYPGVNFPGQQNFAPPGVFKRNYKTVLCRHFARNGRCLMGNMCDFKHSDEGTSSVVTSMGPGNNPLYKTAPCKNWSKTGTCPYEKVCQFKHDEDLKS